MIFGRDFYEDFTNFKEEMNRQGLIAPYAPAFDWAYVDMVASDLGYKIAVAIMMKGVEYSMFKIA